MQGLEAALKRKDPEAKIFDCQSRLGSRHTLRKGCVDEIAERVLNAHDNVIPGAGVALPKEARGRVPGAVVAIEQPTPVRNEG